MSALRPDFHSQIRHMIAFIQQEAAEKAEEIDAKSDEEFNIEKGRIVHTGRLGIMNHYDKKENLVELQKKIQISQMENIARIHILKLRFDVIKNLTEITRERLKRITSDSDNYGTVLNRLLLQGLFVLVYEPVVYVQSRKADVSLVAAQFQAVSSEYEQRTKKKIKLISDTKYLPDHCSGGVVLHNKNRTVKVANSLDDRLNNIIKAMEPDIRTALFGPNKNRKFFD